MKSKNDALRITLEVDEILVRKDSYIKRLFSW
jgi:hypothetical protein